MHPACTLPRSVLTRVELEAVPVADCPAFLPNRVLVFPPFCFLSSSTKAAGDDSIKTLSALAVDELLLNANLDTARMLFQV